MNSDVNGILSEELPMPPGAAPLSMKIIPLHWRGAVKKLGGRAVALASPCPMRLGGTLPSRSQPVLDFFTASEVQGWVVAGREGPTPEG
jgi:hypothetical protein